MTTELLGSDLLAYVEIEADPVVTAEVIEVAADIDVAAADGLVEEAARRRTPIVGRFDIRSKARVGGTVEMVVNPSTCTSSISSRGSPFRAPRPSPAREEGANAVDQAHVAASLVRRQRLWVADLLRGRELRLELLPLPSGGSAPREEGLKLGRSEHAARLLPERQELAQLVGGVRGSRMLLTHRRGA